MDIHTVLRRKSPRGRRRLRGLSEVSLSASF